VAFINKRYNRFLVLIIIGVVVGWGVFSLLDNKPDSGKPGNASQSVPVTVAPVQRGPIALRRMFSGTLEATAQFVVAPKVGGRVAALLLDLSDPVIRGQEVARLDNKEYVQAVVQARADLAVAKANLAEAGSALEIATRELSRIKTLNTRGVASESQFGCGSIRPVAETGRSGCGPGQAGQGRSGSGDRKHPAWIYPDHRRLDRW